MKRSAMGVVRCGMVRHAYLAEMCETKTPYALSRDSELSLAREIGTRLCS